MTGIDTLRPLSAGRLLAIRREVAEREPDEIVRGLLCNAEVLAECCFSGEERTFCDASAVLGVLTVREMEDTLRRLSGESTLPTQSNPAFDEARFCALREE